MMSVARIRILLHGILYFLSMFMSEGIWGGYEAKDKALTTQKE